MDSYLQCYSSETPVSTIRSHRQIISFLKKYPFSPTESRVDRRSVAQSKFWAAERQCQLTNTRLTSDDVGIPSWVPRARDIISSVLEELTPARIMKIIALGNHGPGATTASTRNRTTPYYKFGDFPYTCTPAAMPYALAAISADPHWMQILESSGRRTCIPQAGTPTFQKEIQIFHDCVEAVNSDKVTFVPKDARTDRPIAVGNSLNMYLQLGVKTYMEKRLKAFGIDLTDQVRNQRYAYLGSVHSTVDDYAYQKQFSTIDLASASDTISLELVRMLLPTEWFAFLDDLRHKTGILDDIEFTYSKFSAMGNGFTFPLETLIFWACCKAALDDKGLPSTTNDLIAYGDDIICRYEGSACIIDALTWAGFTVNTEKTFLTGSFKESCGADYFSGNDVRPFYLKREILTYEDIYFVCNSVAQKIMSFSGGSDLCSLYQAAIDQIPPAHRRYIPMVAGGDCGLRSPLSIACRKTGNAMWLDQSTIVPLRRKGVLRSEMVSDPFYIDEFHRPVKYAGRADIRLYISLRSSSVVPPDLRFCKPGDILHFEASTSGIVTRRGATNVTTRVRSCSNWNGECSKYQLLLHPLNWVK